MYTVDTGMSQHTCIGYLYGGTLTIVICIYVKVEYVVYTVVTRVSRYPCIG